MSLITVSSLKRISALKLAEMLLAVDTTGGANADGSSTTSTTTTAGREQAGGIAIVDVRDDDHIGGHIRNSLHFPSRSLDAMMPTLLRRLADKEIVVFHCALSQQRGPGAALQYLREKEAAAAASGASAGRETQQKVYILDRGFVGWQEIYGLDERLTEGYRKDLWDEY